MKKICMLLFIIAFTGFLVFPDTSEEEVDFLLFLPDSSNRFINEEQAMVHLDNVARYLQGRDLEPGQIIVYGYTAFVPNDIDPVSLSMDRAIFVINELVSRGVSRALFAEPNALGDVDTWGNNQSEDERSPNRRVRIVLEGRVLTAVPQPVPEPAPVPVPPPAPQAAPVQESTPRRRSIFPWILLLPLLLLLILFAARRKKKEPVSIIPEPAPKPVPPPAPPVVVPAAIITAAPVEKSYVVVNLEEEIRMRAYELYLARNGESEDAYTDWCMAVVEVCARYEARGHETYPEDESWWARREEEKKSNP